MLPNEPRLPFRRITRWWSAPARFTAASLTLLRKAGLRREQTRLGNAWVRQTPVGIRAGNDGHGAALD